MTTAIQETHSFTSFEKIPLTLYTEADEACKAVTNEMAELMHAKLRLAECEAMEAFVRWHF